MIRLLYHEPKIKDERCGKCCHSYCFNPGAYIPGYRCKLIEKMIAKGERKSNVILDLAFGSCNYFNHQTQQ
jgi:hypothetical protein